MHVRISKFINNLLPEFIHKKYLNWRHKELLKTFHNNPIQLAIKEYRHVFGCKPNLVAPQNLIEKIIWLQFNSDTSLWTLCADKYRVRQFIADKGQKDILCKLYGVWNDASQIEFSKLPSKFVLKTNNSCGQIILVKDKSKISEVQVIDTLKQWMDQGYGYLNAQMHYTRIKPCIIAEEYLETTIGETLQDYKIWCFNGKPECILVCKDRVPGSGIYSLSMYDTQWNNISHKALNPASPHFDGTSIEKPLNLEKMLEIAHLLSEDFPEVRVDLYNLNGRIVFGELTFTTGYGSYKKEFYEYLGSKISTPS